MDVREPRRVLFYTVDQYGWTWQRTNPTPKLLRAELVEAWAEEQATDVQVEVPGRRPVSV